MKYVITYNQKKILADTLTPVNLFLKLRDVFANSILLESSDYHGLENSLSIIACDPLAAFTVKGHFALGEYPDGRSQTHDLQEVKLLDALHSFRSAFAPESLPEGRLPAAGLFGYTSYDAVCHWEDVPLHPNPEDIPEMIYRLYRYVLIIDHFHDVLTLVETECAGAPKARYSLAEVQHMLFSARPALFPFARVSDEVVNQLDEEFLEAVGQAQEHCQRGDVFQLVLSRRFSLRFHGDEFNVYRALRSINPSPYLFYFDYGNFRLFGSSPEAQLQVNRGEAIIHPIAGTFRRTGNDQEDAALAVKLASDEKENAEHVMLVDLARNDLSRHTQNVRVDVFREVQYYSHVIHLVSKVVGTLPEGTDVLPVMADTFPAGTLSGAPKHKAMNLIASIEKENRGFYGGAIGYIGFANEINQAIMIRTFLARDSTLIYQAGAGIVAKSVPQQELEEVNNKIGALRKAIALAETLNEQP